MQFQKARGTRDMYNEEVIIYRNIIKSLTQCAIKYNYQEFITPIFENAQLFLRAVGDTTDIIQKEIYQFNDKNDRLLALRPEGTAGIVRAIIENKLYKSKQTLKYFYYGSMFRYERPQKGRQRQFNQFGIETVGVKHPLVDVEVMMMALEMIKSFSIPNLTLNINYFGSNETKNKYQIALKEQLLNQSKQLCENCQIRVKVSPLRVLDCKICTKLNLEIPYLNDFLTNEEKTYFTTIINSLKNNKVNFIIDEHLVRGLDYYNGIIFEITTIDSRIGESQNTLLGGGRYDNLFNELGSPLKIPAIGFAIGIERLMLLLVENKNINKPPIIDLQIIALSELGLIIASDLLLQLRKENYHIDMEYNLYQDKNKSQIIDRSLAKNILFLKEKNQVSFYSFVKKEMIKLIFDTEQQLFSKVKNLLLEENEEYGKLFRTHTCGNLTQGDITKEIIISGWVKDIRINKFGIFIDLRDMYGTTQVIVKPDNGYYQKIKNVKVESVLKVIGTVVLRKNKDAKTANDMIEVVAKDIEILSNSINLPFVIKNDNTLASEELRLQYRYLDLRRPAMNYNIKFKHQVLSCLRTFLNQNNFLEIDTPCLTKSTPEGARDFLVPARIQKKHFYALPQSPQIYKQLLMISGIDKYYQIAKCFRDEDFRADRQPEFQQLDLEMAFTTSKEIKLIVENMIISLFNTLKIGNIPSTFSSITYDQAMDLYGSDKPDLRCTCKLINININNNSDGFIYKGFIVNDKMNETTIKKITEISNQHGGKTLIIYDLIEKKIIHNNSKVKFDDLVLAEEISKIKYNNNFLIFVYEQQDVANKVMGAIRSFYINDLSKRINHKDFMNNIENFEFIWIIDWPMFEQEENKWQACHHPFTSPKNPEKLLDIKNKDLGTLTADAYDLVLNGFEIAGGSIRIHDYKLQKKIFELLDLSKTEIENKFGFFLSAFNYGVPPHGGIAFGIDRLLMILIKNESIRDTIAFPKNNRGICLLTNSPSEISSDQLSILNLEFKK